jgi:O-antigen/teichoic acid export membrane protein
VAPATVDVVADIGLDDSSPTASDSTGMRRRQVRGSALLLVGRMLALLLTTATQVVIVRAMSKTDFGAFAYALALSGAGLTLLSLGQGRLLSRFMAKYEEQRDYDRMFGSMLLAFLTIVVTSTLALGALFLLPGALIGSAVHDPATVKVVLILVFLGPLDALDQVFISLFAVFSKPTAIFFRKYLFTPLLRLAIVLTLAVTHASVTFLAIGYVVAGVAGLSVSALVFVRVLRERDLLRHLRLRRLVLPVRAVLSFSLPLITGELFFLSLNVGGVLILAYYHSAASVASYRAVWSPARLNNAIQQVFVPLFLPLAARLFLRKDIDGLRKAYWHTATVVTVLTFPVFALTGPLAPVITVVLFGKRYADSGLVLSLLATGYYFSVGLGFNAYLLQVCERIRFLVGVNVFVAAVNIALSLILVQRYSAVGVAIANLCALVLQNVINQWALRRTVHTGFIDRGSLRCYLSILACALALWAVQVLVHPGLVLGLAAAAVAWAVVLMASRSAMELGETFPELQRVPLVRRLV